MKYESTRGQEKNLKFEEVLLSGYAKDHGLYMPEHIPRVSEEEFTRWSKLSYVNLVYEVLRKFIDSEEISNEDLRDICSTSFNRFSHPSTIGVKCLEKNLSVFELFHGPTLAFKDLALVVVASLLDYFMQKKKKHLIALVGTSGDTGSAALESVRGRKNIDIIVLFPKDRCTRIQQLQMTTVSDKNSHLFCVEGTSDDLDVPIKQCFEDEEFVQKHNLICLNSVNIGRILAQIPLYIYAYYQMAPNLGEKVEIIVPTGAAGSLTAGSIAHRMGFPIRLIAAVNINNIVARTLAEGIFSTAEQVYLTYANAMDIQNPYNMERIYHLYSQKDVNIVSSVMETFEKKGSAEIPRELLSSITNVISGNHVVTDKEVIDIIKQVKEQFDYFVCPHTATAASYFFSLGSSDTTEIPRGIFATASPEKFPEVVSKSGYEAPTHRVKHLFEMEEKYLEMKKGEDWFLNLKSKINSLTQSKINKV